MSDPVSPLNGAVFSGIAEVRELGLQGMITLRGDLSSGPVAAVATQIAGVAMPGPGAAQMDGGTGLAWMSPDELLVLCPYADAAEVEQRLTVALEGAHALVANVSDARALFALSGPHARAVLAKLAPVDLAPGQFTPGMFRRTRMAQIPAAFWMAGPETFHIVTFRSVAQYAFDLLSVAATEGSEVGGF